MHFRVKRKFHEGFSLDTIIKELLKCQKKKIGRRKRRKKTGSGVIARFLQCLELNEFDSFFANFRVTVRL